MGSTFGERLHQLRKERRWTLAQLSQRSGLSVSHISSLERGTRTKPSMEVVAKLANALQVPIHVLQGGETYSSETAGDRVLARFSPELQKFLLQEDSVPYILLAKQLHDAMEKNQSELTLLETLGEFIRTNKKG